MGAAATAAEGGWMSRAGKSNCAYDLHLFKFSSASQTAGSLIGWSFGTD